MSGKESKVNTSDESLIHEENNSHINSLKLPMKDIYNAFYISVIEKTKVKTLAFFSLLSIALQALAVVGVIYKIKTDLE